MILKRIFFTLIFSCLTVFTLNNGMEDSAAGVSGMLEIETSDGCKHTVAKELCLHSEVIRNMLEDCGAGNIPIPLPEVSSNTLEMLLPMLQLIHEKKQEELSNKLNERSLEELAELLKASNYLDIPLLLEAVSTSISVKLSSHEVRQQFCNNKDFLGDNGLTELPPDLSVLIVSKLGDYSGLRVYLLNHCSIFWEVIDRCDTFSEPLESLFKGGKLVALNGNRIKIGNVMSVVMSGQWLRELEGHTGWVNSAKFNKKGDKVASASNDGTVRIWDVETGQCLQVLEGYYDCVRLAEFNSLGDKVVSASDDGTVRIWDVETSQCLRVLERHSTWVTLARFNESGDKVVLAYVDRTVSFDISELNELYRYLQQDLTLEQVLFLLCAYEAKQNGQQLDCRNCPWLLECYGSLPDCIQRILVETKAVVVPSSLQRLVNGTTEFVHQYGTSILTGASAVGLASWLLMKGLARK